jgi:hypothetical protein
VHVIPFLGGGGRGVFEDVLRLRDS